MGAICMMSFGVAYGADLTAGFGEILIRRVVEGVTDERLVLKDWGRHSLSTSPLKLPLEQGVVYESLEREPAGKHRVWQCPDQDEANYATLKWLERDPDGAFVVEARYEDYPGATGEPDIEVGGLWYASNPAHPQYGKLLRKDS
jgi:hypothetical protein